ncbi:MAG: DUF2971 domain-containing protein, partial [Bdellovibrionales bacterium]|nr:DUF2971 domain-containing protein [Bdellovibrionales bacterium]
LLLINPKAELPKEMTADVKDVLLAAREVDKGSPGKGLKFFEDNLDIKSFVEGEQKRMAESDWSDIMKQMRIVCLSEVLDSIPMWSYYSDSHRGVLIGIDAETKRFEQVQYAEQFPVEIQPAVFAAKRHIGLIKFEVGPMFKAQLATKSHWWKNEKEWRVVLDVGLDKPDPHFAYIGPFSRVVCGCRMSDINKEGLKNLLSKLHPEIKLYQTELEQGNYGLHLREIEIGGSG